MDPIPAPLVTPAAKGYQVDDLFIDLQLRRVARAETDLGIAGRSFELLLALVRAAPGVMSTEELMECVWPGVVINPETVTQRIKLLRHSLGDSAENPRYIAVLRGYGYRLVAAVAAAAVLPQRLGGAPVPPPVPVAAPQSPAARIRRRVPTLLAAALMIGVVGAWWGLEHRSGAPVAASSGPRADSATTPPPSVAVMPFANLTGDPAKEYLGDGMAEELINSLARVPGLKVPARTSAFAYKGRNVDVRQVARNLGVAMILEGSVRGAAERLRISARLVDAASGFQIWSQDYDRQSADLFKLQDDLAAQIVQALRQHVNVSLPTPAHGSRTTQNPRAYDLYLQGRAVFRGTRSSLPQSLALIDQALALDPNFADALAQRAVIRAYPAVFGSAPKAALDEAQRDATRALALNPNSANGHTVLEAMQAIHWHWLDAERNYRATMATSADDPYFRNFHVTFLLRAAGRLRQAESELLVSYRLAPTLGYTIHELIVTESLLGHDAEAVRLIVQFRGIVGGGDPPGAENALPYLRRALRAGRYAEAAKWGTLMLSSSLRDTGGAATMKIFCAALENRAQRPAADRALRDFMPQLLHSSEVDHVKMFFVAAFAMVDDLAGAYELTQELLDQRFNANGSGGVDWGELWTPEMHAFRNDPRFQALMDRVKLPEYWDQYGPPDACDLKVRKLTCR
ncbi:MAG TPA: winged helix-turn-helix domain-containing protein [Steroidobacteraceae bacterium]